MSDLESLYLGQPDRLWLALDSFWRAKTTADTRELLHFQSYANAVAEVTTRLLAAHYLGTQSVPEMEAYWRIPWYPLVVYRDRVINQSTVTYGQGFLYADPPQIVYGEQLGTNFVYPLEDLPIARVGCLTDGLTDTRVVIDASQFTYDAARSRLIFGIDIFDVMPVRIEELTGREYTVVWLRDVQMDVNQPFDQVGWVVRYDRIGNDNYTETLRSVWEMVLLGPSIRRYERGMLRSLELPFAVEQEVVRRVESDGFRQLISTDTHTYGGPLASTPLIAAGAVLQPGQPLVDTLQFLEYQDLESVPANLLPGLILDIPLSTGAVARLSFANVTTAWDFELGRPSEWRFPIGGDAPQVEQYWQDVQDRNTAAGTDFAVIYGLPAAVNPLHLLIRDIFRQQLYVATVRLAGLQVVPTGFHDRALQLMGRQTRALLQQFLPEISDGIDLGTNTSDTVGYGYHEAVPTEVISVAGSGTDLQFFDYVPLVVTS